MSKRILVAYASGTGSTAEVAEAIAGVLREEPITVDVRHVDEVDSLEPYSALVVGSSIRVGRWLPEAAAFVEELGEQIGEKPIAFFTTCLTMVDNTAGSRRIVLAYMDPILQANPDVEPIGLGLFAGSLDPSRRLIMSGDAGPQGDYRDWDAIRSWARRIRPALLANVVDDVETKGDAELPADLSGVVLSFTDMSGRNLSEVDLSGAELNAVDLSDADLAASSLNWANISQAGLKRTNLHQANLIGAVLQDADLNEADLSEAILNGADLTGADLRGANLARADLNWADLSGANLQGAHLQGANLAWANLGTADLAGANLTGAQYNSHTRWPEQFDPQAAGAILVGQLSM